jgi:hypothetical protein
MNNYSNLVEAIIDLEARGYVVDFTIMGNSLLCAQDKIFLARKEFNILEVYDFFDQEKGENVSVYGIEAADYGLKGILLEKPGIHYATSPPFLQQKMAEYLSSYIGYWC